MHILPLLSRYKYSSLNFPTPHLSPYNISSYIHIHTGYSFNDKKSRQSSQICNVMNSKNADLCFNAKYTLHNMTIFITNSLLFWVLTGDHMLSNELKFHVHALSFESVSD